MNHPPDVAMQPDDLAWITPLLRGVFEIEDVTVGALGGAATRLRGRFVAPTERAYAELAPRFAARGRTLVFRREQGHDVILSLDGVNRPTPNNRWLPPVLALLTVASILGTYLLMYGMEELSWESARAGLGQAALFTVALVAVLLAHEMGHYLAARRLGLAVTLPYLIPFPLSPFGTMGAVIRMKDIPPNKRAMLLTGAAGPLAGLVVTLPLLIVGLLLSEVRPLPASGSYIVEGNSLLYLLLKYLVHGQWLPSDTHDLFMHPLAFASWAGLLVTAFNLIPAGQLDGGHIAYAWLGPKARYLTWGVLAILLGLGFVWPGWFLWAALIFALARNHQEPLDSITPLRRREIAIAVGLFIVLVLTFTPLPLRFIN
jgi:membrane-associated protease RseP (regulator of RpoE activity)